jgi:hypothetical protein
MQSSSFQPGLYHRICRPYLKYDITICRDEAVLLVPKGFQCSVKSDIMGLFAFHKAKEGFGKSGKEDYCEGFVFNYLKKFKCKDVNAGWLV